MIFELLFDFVCTIIYNLFSAFEILKLPLDIINSLCTILEFGVWIVGIDVLAIFTSTVIFWWGIHLSIGVVVWVWKLLPLT